MADAADPVEHWAGEAQRLRWLERWVQQAIFPSEMVFFLARCDEGAIDVVIESGRQDGYSTGILAEWARQRGRLVVSVDLESDPGRATRCRERLGAPPGLTLVRGDTTHVMAPLLREHRTRRIALLLDGPKDFCAVSLLCAATSAPSVALVALHNLVEGQPALRALRRVAAQPLFHEDRPAVGGGAWHALRAQERDLAQNMDLCRPLEPSSLAVVDVTSEVRARARWAWAPVFRLVQPPLVRLAWSCRLEALAARAFALSLASERGWQRFRYDWLPRAVKGTRAR